MNTDKYKFLSQLHKRFPYVFNFKHNDEDVIGYDPVIYFEGFINRLEIKTINERGKLYFDFLKNILGDFDHIKIFATKIVYEIVPNYSEEFEHKNSATVFQELCDELLKYFRTSCKELGVYGAFKYDTVTLFEKIDSIDSCSPIFKFGLYDKVVNAPISKNANECPEIYSISDPSVKYDSEDYLTLCNEVKGHFLNGDAFEVVIANKLSAKFEGSPIALYRDYCAVSPTSYQYFFDFGSEFLVGCSPEMLVSIDETGVAESHPISGTVPRADDVYEDHNNLVYLLTSPKEKAELDMLIDLARNDLSKVCKKGVTVSSYREIQKLSYVYHTFARVNGVLKEGVSAMAAVFACMPAGTLSGAPKVEAMKIIAKLEKEPRGYYGGCVGYFRPGNILNMAITIRSAEITGDSLAYRAGATLLFDSDFEMEYKETINKMGGFLKLVQPININQSTIDEKSFANR